MDILVGIMTSVHVKMLNRTLRRVKSWELIKFLILFLSAPLLFMYCHVYLNFLYFQLFDIQDLDIGITALWDFMFFYIIYIDLESSRASAGFNVVHLWILISNKPFIIFQMMN